MSISGRGAAAILAAVMVAAGCTPQAEGKPFEGTWVSEGFGMYLDVHAGNADVYEHTSIHCALAYGGTTRGISAVLSRDGEQLVLTDAGRVVRFDPFPGLPTDCTEDYHREDAARVLEVAAATVAELYSPGVDPGWAEGIAFADLRGVSDQAVTFAALTALLAPLGDPGIRLVVDDPLLWAGVWSVGRGPFADAEPYLPEGLQAASVAGEGGMVTGTFGSVGYLGFSRLGAFAPDEEDSQRVLAAQLDSLLAEASAVILDLRGSSTGSTVEAMLVGSRFVPDERLVATQMSRSTPAGTITVRPTSAGPFAGRVVVLVGPGTAGAGEMLTLALRDLPDVLIIGEPTAGSPTAPLARLLPNGWSLGVPALDLVTPDGTSWSGRPIIPDVDATTTATDLASGEDPGLDAARAYSSTP